MEHRPTTKGAGDLDAYLKRHGISLNAFCERHDIDYAQAHRIRSGVRGKRVSVDFAAKVHDATGGEVDIRSWCQSVEGPAAAGDGAAADAGATAAAPRA